MKSSGTFVASTSRRSHNGPPAVNAKPLGFVDDLGRPERSLCEGLRMTPAHARPDAPPCPPVRQRDRRRPFRASTTHGPYRMPAPLADLLRSRLEPQQTRNSAFALALFLSRFWAAPRRLVMAFPIDRRALAGHVGLDGMSEGKIRGAIARLEAIGFLVREVQPPGRRYRRTADGLQRRPVLFRFGPDFAEAFRSANAVATAGRGDRSRPRRPLVPPLAQRPSLALPTAFGSLATERPVSSILRIALLSGQSAPRPLPWSPLPPTSTPDPGLSAALDRLRAARASHFAPGFKAETRP